MSVQTYMQKVSGMISRSSSPENILHALLSYWTRQLTNSRKGKPIPPDFTPSDLPILISEIELKIKEIRNAKK